MEMSFHRIKPGDTGYIRLIAEWYQAEWGMDPAGTIRKLQQMSAQTGEFHFLFSINNEPVATGGVHHHVGILDKIPALCEYKHWLALVYTVPSKRHQGLGSQLCTILENHAASLQISELALFTHTAENLYKRLGWSTFQRVKLPDKKIAVMKKKVSR